MDTQDLWFYICLGVSTSVAAVCMGKILMTLLPQVHYHPTTGETSIV